MKWRNSLAAVVFPFALITGCQNPGTPAKSSAAPAREPKPVTVALVKQPDNALLHRASGMRFPERVGEFKRLTYHQSGGEGLNFTCEYQCTSGGIPIAMTVSLYPAPSVTGDPSEGVIREARPGMADSEYQVEVKKILMAHPQTSVVAEREYALAQGVQLHVGRYVEFEYSDRLGGRVQPVTSRLYLFNNVDEKWAVRFRVTCPKGYPADGPVNAFLSELRWSIRDT